MMGEKRWRYRVTEVWGSMEGRLEVGAVVVDHWKGEDAQWDVLHMPTGEITGGWTGDLIGLREKGEAG